MLLGLMVKNKEGFVDGTIEKPTGELLHPWKVCNGVVKGWILNALSKEISAIINFSNTTREMWVDLQQRYQRKNRPRIFQLRREISNLTQDQLSVSAYFAKLKALRNELASYRPSCSCGNCSCGGVKDLVKYFQTEHVIAFLMGLNKLFAPICTQLLLMELEPTITRVFGHIAQEVEQRVSLNGASTAVSSVLPPSEATAFFAKSTNSGPSSSHTQSIKKKELPQCTHCHVLGHTVDRCYKIHGYPPQGI